MQNGSRGPSVRARAANLAFRYTVKPAFRGERVTVERLRRIGGRLDRYVGRLPRGTRTTPLQMGDFTAERICIPGSKADRILLYLPGGGFVMRSPAVHRALVARICAEAQAEALLAFYRLAPEDPFPAALEDCVAAYERLLDEVSASQIVIGGDSAGGCLTLTTLMSLRDRGAPLPAAAFMLSAVTDLRGHRNGSRTANAEADSMLSADESERWHGYLVAERRESLSDPLVSPLLGSFRGLPPLLLQASTSEILLDDSRLAAERASEAGVECSLELFEGLSHVWQILPWLPESRRALQSIGAFVRTHTHS